MTHHALRHPERHPVARYVVETHSQLDGCYEIARHSAFRQTQRIGNYTDYDIAVEVAMFLNKQVSWEAP